MIISELQCSAVTQCSFLLHPTPPDILIPIQTSPEIPHLGAWTQYLRNLKDDFPTSPGRYQYPPCYLWVHQASPPPQPYSFTSKDLQATWLPTSIS